MAKASTSFAIRAITICVLFAVTMATAADAPDTNAGDSPVGFFSERAVVEVDRTAVIPFRIEASAEGDRAAVATIDDTTIAEIAREARVLDGETVGYLRVRGVAPGQTTLTVASAPITLEVTPKREPSFDERYRPVITSPGDGAVVWGEFPIGVEVWPIPNRPRREITLRLSSGASLEPLGEASSEFGPDRRLAFTMDVTAMPEGSIELVAIATNEAGDEWKSDPVTVTVMHPTDEELIIVEAEAESDIERPRRFGENRPRVYHAESASGGAFVNNAGAYPPVCQPFEIPETGWYQMFARAAGDRARGALPTIVLYVDEANQPSTNGRLVMRSWARTPIGVPIRLEAGRRILTPFFVNDFYARGLADRNLRLDTLELARVDRAGAAAAAADGAGGMGMSMSMTMNAEDDAPAMMEEGGAMMDSMNAGMPGGSSRDAVADHIGLAATPVRVAFVELLDRAPITGELEVEGLCWWDGADGRAPAPVVRLLLNGVEIGRQRSGAPRFWVDTGRFTPGVDNTLKLVAELNSGARAETPAQRVRIPALGYESSDFPRPRRMSRYSVHDEGWEPAARQSLRNEHYPKERRSFALHSNGQIGLELPDALTGEFVVHLEARGDHYDGGPIARIGLERDGESSEVGEVTPPNWWDTREVGTISLVEGPKRLTVAFTNDKYEQGKGDRNLWIQAIVLQEKAPDADAAPPRVAVLYPPDQHEAYRADAVVVEAADERGLAAVELLIDGAPTGIVERPFRNAGRMTLPLPARVFEPGEHDLAVRVQDTAGNSTTSEPRSITILDEPPAEPGRYRRAVHLLNRFAYGPDAHELAEVLVMGEDAWLDEHLAREFDDPGDLAMLGHGLARFPNLDPYQVQRRAITHTIQTPNPVRVRFTHWTQNHFSTWIRKTSGPAKWREYIEYSDLGPGAFFDLLHASARLPSMLIYLDQESSYAGQLNENYAREIMELHTLGVDGGYTQDDVTNLAALITGWTYSREGDGRSGGPMLVGRFRFDPKLNDPNGRRILGVDFPSTTNADEQYDRALLALETLASHPSAARFVSRKLAEHYTTIPARDDLVEDLASVYHATGGDMAALLRAIARHDAFWDTIDEPRLAHPFEFAARLDRCANRFHPWGFGDYLSLSGTGLFDRATPDGYPEEDSAYTDSNAMLQRWRYAQASMWQLVQLAPDAVRYNRELAEEDWERLLIDLIAIRLTGFPLGDASYDAAVRTLRDASGQRAERALNVATFIAQTPEANLR
ncbi:MAG: DUF1800 family protein [Phycisphaerales bacterium]